MKSNPRQRMRKPPNARATDPRTTATPLLFVAALGLSVAVLAFHAAHYRGFMVDDAFISLRYSDRLLHGHGLTWNDGEVVEGYSNLLWVLSCSLLGATGLDLVVAARVLGFLGSVAAISSVVWAARGPSFRLALPGFVAGLAVAVSGSMAIWTVGGLEQPLLAGLLAWALVLLFPRLEEEQPPAASFAAPGVLLGLTVLTRADAALFAAAACVGVVVARGMNRAAFRSAFLLAILPALFFLAQLAYRRAFYHEWLPNSAYAKVGFSVQRLWSGLEYVGGLIYVGALAIPAFLAFLVRMPPSDRTRVRLLGAILLAWLAYLALVGGDFFPGRRHLVPAVILLAFLAAITMRAWISRLRRPLAALAAGIACLAVLTTCQFLDPKNAAALRETWVWDGEAIGTLLADAYGAKKPLLAVDPAGCVPYFSRLPSIDMLGINDHYLAHHRPADFGKGVVGHELGSGKYVLSRKPDLVLFNLPTGNTRPFFRSGREMVFEAGSDFLATFRPVTFECEKPRHLKSLVWARLDGGAIGIQRTGDEVRIPGHLLSANKATVARLDGEGRMGVQVLPGAPAGIPGVWVPTGRWIMRSEQSGGHATLQIWHGSRNRTEAGEDGMVLDVADKSGEYVMIGIGTDKPEGAHVREIVLTRAP